MHPERRTCICCTFAAVMPAAVCRDLYTAARLHGLFQRGWLYAMTHCANGHGPQLVSFPLQAAGSSGDGGLCVRACGVQW